jgi:LCP family protein required for cell wall assembly
LTPTTRRSSAGAPKSSPRAVLLSFLWPGLGQAYLGRRRPALIFAIPALLARLFLVPNSSRLLVLATVILAIWRIASMTLARYDAHVTGPRAGLRGAPPRTDPRSTFATRAFIGLVALVVLMHGALAWTGIAFINAASNIYVGGQQPTPAPGSTDNPFGSRPTPYATAKPGDRINFLLIGADSGLGYSHSLTDSMIVVSVDPTKNHVDMLSLPRDIAEFKMYSGGTYAGKLNSLASYAAAHPETYPDGGIGTLSREIGYLIGAPIHYYAFVDLAGFKSVIDAVGGIDIVNPKDIADAGYEFPDGKRGFFLTAGPHHLNGRVALAYVRSRDGPGDNDFTRARRQQELLVALRAHLTDPTMLPKLPTILDALSRTVQTDVSADSVPDLILMAKQIPESEVTHYVLGPPYAKNPTVSNGTYELIIDESKFAALSIRLFGSESRYAPAATPSPSATP